MAICDLQVNVLSLLKGSNSTTSNTGANVIRKDDQPELELREACQEQGYLKGFKPERALKLVATPALLAHGKQAMKVTKSQQGKMEHPVQGYKVGALCYARYFGPRCTRQPRWIPAVVTKVYGTRNVNVRVVPQGPTWRRHIEQLRPRHASKEDAEPEHVTARVNQEDRPSHPRRSEQIRTTGRN